MRRVIGGAFIGIGALMAFGALLSLLATGDLGLFLGGLIIPAICVVLGWWIGNFSAGNGRQQFGGTTEDHARLQRDQAVAAAREQRVSALDQQRAEMAAMRDEMRRAAEARNRELGL
ncbi:Uncharacterised protein [Mycobacteroides abscessus]|uniref:hypothetical protein n=1 Tax=Mycobacteroides abscessus TaxID=36809 RepID=UPI0005E98F07|nr:hypothetical protein [Mycobacteroides abscessus]CPX20637.1 Uncharacterised protein [Mycobacteroides abscessus]CRG61232.1 Uncharacterised protein [Mycobacteroides abscessus]